MKLYELFEKDITPDYTEFKPEYSDRKKTFRDVEKSIESQTGNRPVWYKLKYRPHLFNMSNFKTTQELYRNFTSQSIKDLMVVDIPKDVGDTMKWLNRNGKSIKKGRFDSKILPGLVTQFALYQAMGFSFLITNDGLEVNVTAWPSSEDINNMGECTSTTSGAIATTAQPLGGIQRRIKKQGNKKQ